MRPKPSVIDVIDMSEPVGAIWKDCLEGHNTATIGLGGMSNSIEKMVSMILTEIGAGAGIRCLAIWGHGAVDHDDNPLGIHLLAGGWDAQFNRGAFTTSIISELQSSLARLKGCFQQNARVELRGCGPAGTKKGIEAMKMLASPAVWNVPVQAAKKNQPLMTWRRPVVEVSPNGSVREGIPGIEYNERT